MPTIPRTRTQRVLLLLLLASATLVAASFVAGFLMRAHVQQEQRRAMQHGMMVDPNLPPGHPPVQGLPPGHPPIQDAPAPPVVEGIRI